MLVLEDCHWLDPLSRDLLDVIARAVDAGRVAARPRLPARGGAAAGARPRRASRGSQELRLDGARGGRDDRGRRGRSSRSSSATSTEVPEPLLDLVVSRAQGNPFYAEELLNYVHAQEVDLVRRARAPLARAARQPAQPGAQPHRHAQRGAAAHAQGRERRRPRLQGARAAGRLPGARDDRRRPRASRNAPAARPRHRRPRGGRVVPLQARGHAGGRLREPPVRAPRDAARRRRPLPRAPRARGDRATPRPARAPLLAQRRRAEKTAVPAACRRRGAGGVRQRGGDRLLRAPGAAPRRRRARRPRSSSSARCSSWSGAGTTRADVETAALELAEVDRRRERGGLVRDGARRGGAQAGRFDEASERLERARGRLRRCSARRRALGRVLHLEGTLAAQRGDTRRRARALRGRASRSARLSATGRDREPCSAISGSSPSTRATTSSRARPPRAGARAAYSELGDRWAIAVLDDEPRHDRDAPQRRTDEAREPFEEAMRLNREVGDSWMVALTHNNLGNAAAASATTPSARSHTPRPSHLPRLRRRWALAFLLEDVALLAALTGDPRGRSS